MRKKRTATILAIFTGIFGLHWFYLNYKLEGLFYVLFSWTFIPIILSWIDAYKFYKMTPVEFDYNYQEHIRKATNLKELRDLHDKIIKDTERLKQERAKFKSGI